MCNVLGIYSKLAIQNDFVFLRQTEIVSDQGDRPIKTKEKVTTQGKGLSLSSLAGQTLMLEALSCETSLRCPVLKCV